MNSRLNSSLRIAVAGVLTVAAFSGCSDDDNGSGPPPGQEISLELDGFPVSTPEEGNYELWISFAGTGTRHDTAQSMGKFRVNADGQVVKPDGSPNRKSESARPVPSGTPGMVLVRLPLNVNVGLAATLEFALKTE